MRAMLGLAYFGADKFSDAAKTFSPLGLTGMQDSTVGWVLWAIIARPHRRLEERWRGAGRIRKAESRRQSR